MKQYSEYKDSGVKWIGEIPSLWSTTRIKNIATFNPSKTKENKFIVGYAPMECVRNGNIEAREIEISKISSGLTYFEEGDLVVAKVTPCFENGNIAIARNLKNGCAYGSSELFVFRCDKIVDKYLFFYMQDERFKHKCCSTMTGTGGLKRVSSEFIRNAYITIPSSEEQQSIVNYLDTKVNKIDNYIATAEKEIAALDELKQVTIADAVTHGINPNAPMKDSGIPWIGMVPEHWEVNKIRSLFKLSNQKTKDPSCTLLSLSQYTGVRLKSECDNVGMFEAETTIGYNVVQKGQFVMNIMLAWNGSYSVSNYNGVISPAYCVFDFIRNCDKKYFDYLLRLKAYSGAFKTLSKGLIDSRLRLYPDYFRTFPIVFPPVEEQNEIVTYIDHKVAQIDKVKASELAQIEKLKEYKQRLISDVVTGKVKVTND